MKGTEFLCLPGEVRNLIYSYVILSREFSLMRASRQICEEMVSLMNEQVDVRQLSR